MGSAIRLTPNLPSTTLAADFSGDYCENNDSLGDIDCVDSLAAVSTCTAVDEELWTVTTPKNGNGADCQYSSTLCEDGAGCSACSNSGVASGFIANEDCACVCTTDFAGATCDTANVDCVETTAATSTCTEIGQELVSVTTAQSGDGAACAGASVLCEAGDGAIPANIDCVEETAPRATCTEIGQELVSVTTAQSGDGEACAGDSVLCEAGDGTIDEDEVVHDVDCVEETAPSATCTEIGQELVSVTTAQSGDGAACAGASVLCEAGDGAIPANIDCVEETAPRATCTEIGQELVSVTTAQSGDGEACAGDSVLCEAGDGTVPAAFEFQEEFKIEAEFDGDATDSVKCDLSSAAICKVFENTKPEGTTLDACVIVDCKVDGTSINISSLRRRATSVETEVTFVLDLTYLIENEDVVISKAVANEAFVEEIKANPDAIKEAFNEASADAGESFVIDTVDEVVILDDMEEDVDADGGEMKSDAIIIVAIIGGTLVLIAIVCCTQVEWSCRSKPFSNRDGEKAMDDRLAAAEVQLVDFRPDAKQIQV
ncbi:hypothetical protein TeGR_g3447 [Tetraparma gracilis]|uniref:EGF-like domain-containing protein n=1 Tax=Tetraparma gracilis TaxID=2962635 RepID=A0ABQ6N894_9STRA|nr:hypothetical protein TeGR_g3447 [Tetraparma gracilis]